MNNDKPFLSILDDHHKQFQDTKGSICDIIESISFYESIIPDFFSATGEADGIRDMYKGIKEELAVESKKTVNCVDVNNSAHIYCEYMEGMVKFIHDIGNASVSTEENSDELSGFTEKFENAKTKDSIFIESLYNGKLSDTTDSILTEAVGNIEFLIDFIPQLNRMKNTCEQLKESFLNCENTIQKNLIDESLVMLFESVDNYCYTTLKNVISTYYDINDVLFSESTNSNDANTGFKLFS